MLGPAAPEHGWVPSPRYLMRRSRILALTRDLAPGDLLEVGSGAGMLLQEFACRGFRCTAIDSSPQARSLAAALAREARLAIEFREDAEPGWCDRFDTLFAFEVLEHIADDRSALATWARWLRPGGRLILSVPAHAARWSSADEWAGHHRRYEREDLARLLGEGGFEIEHFECYGFPLTNLSERIGAGYYAWRNRHDARRVRDRSANTARSGTERPLHVRLHPLLASLPGRLALEACLALQERYLTRELGTGYLLRARRR